jgi:O-antigen ligase
VLTLFASTFIAALGVYRLRWGVNAYIFSLPFFPRVIALAIGSGGAALTEQRLAIVLLVLVFIAHYFASKQIRYKFQELTRSYPKLLLILLCLLAAKAAATLLNSELSNMLYWVDECLFSIVLLFLVNITNRNVNDEKQVLWLMILGIMLSGVLSFGEQLKGGVLLQGLVTVDVDTAGRDLLESRVRDNHLRGQALFDNPLLLSEFSCLLLPITVFGIRVFKGYKQLIAIAALLFIPYIIWCAYSRSGALTAAMGLVFLFIATSWKRAGNLGRLLIWLSTISLVSIILFTAIAVISDPKSYFQGNEESDVSSIERAQQYTQVLTAMNESPMLGFGLTQNYTKDLDFLNHLDNYWLRLFLEGGVTAFALFAMFLLLVTKRTFSHLYMTKNQQERFYYATMLSFYGSFALFKFFLSMPTNNAYFYIITGLLLWHMKHVPIDGSLSDRHHENFTRPQ